MSKQCPYCGSYNTDPVVHKYVKRGLVQTGRAVLIVGAMVVGHIFNPNNAKAFGYIVKERTKLGEFKGHKCNECGKLF